MKNPLHYQLSEYDCGPTSMLNAVSYLFQREEVPPEIIRNITLYCLDCYGADGACGKSGTSCAAMMFLSNWLNGYGKTGQLPVSSRHLLGKNVWIGKESLINDALCRGGAVILRVFYDCGHYVLLTGIRRNQLLMFDPYYSESTFTQPGIIRVDNQPFSYNRIVEESCFNRESKELYALGPVEDREAVIVFNEKTKKTPENTIEYFI